MCPPYAATAVDRKRELDYRAEDDCRTLERAAEITGDRDRHMRAKGHARKQIQRMRKITSGGRGRARR